MASLSYNKRSKIYHVYFIDVNGKRRKWSLGKCGQRAAKATFWRIETLIANRRLGTENCSEMLGWLEKLPTAEYEKLSSLGLVVARTPSKTFSLAQLISRFTQTSSVKPGTTAAYKQATDSLLEILGSDISVNSITAELIDDWVAKIKTCKPKRGAKAKLASATVSKRLNVAKAVFAKAQLWGYVKASPCGHLKVANQVNPERSFYVSQELAEQVLEACPDDQWRVLLGLVRFAGLRCPSEVKLLRWDAVDWKRKVMTVTSPKTAGIPGKGSRIVPVCPKLQLLLGNWHKQQQEPVAGPVVPRLQNTGNPHTAFKKILEGKNIKPWPRLLQNLRASCATDLVDPSKYGLPNHAAAQFLGHSTLVAAKHYLQVRDENIGKVTGDGTWSRQ